MLLHLLVCFALIFPAARSLAADKIKIDITTMTAAAFTNRLWHAKDYSHLPAALNLNKNDRALFLQDLKRKKIWKDKIKFTSTPTTVTVHGSQNTVFDFAKASRGILLVNGTAVKFDKKYTGYRQNQLRMNRLRKKTTAWNNFWIPEAHGQSPGADADLIDAYVASTSADFFAHLEILKNDPTKSPMNLLIAQYRNDEAIYLQMVGLDGGDYDIGSINMSGFTCNGDNLKSRLDMQYFSDKAPEPVQEELLNQQLKDFNDAVANMCCQQPGTDCEVRAGQERQLIAERHKSRTGKGTELVLPPLEIVQ